MSKNAKKQTASSKQSSTTKTSDAPKQNETQNDSASSTQTTSPASASGDTTTKPVGDAGTNPMQDTQSLSPGGVGQSDGNHATPGALTGDGSDGGQTDDKNNDGTGDANTNPLKSESTTLPQNGVLREEAGTLDQQGENYKSDQTADKTDEERAQQLGVPQHIANGWQKLPEEGAPEGRILSPGDEFAFDGEEIGNVVVAKENVYRKVTPRGCKRPSYELLIKKGSQMSRTAVQNMSV